MKQRKVSTRDLKDMKVGDKKTFNVPCARDIETAQSLAYRLARIEPEREIKYSTKVDFKNLLITISAESTK